MQVPEGTLRILAIPAIDSGVSRPGIPEQSGHRSERSDAGRHQPRESGASSACDDLRLVDAPFRRFLYLEERIDTLSMGIERLF